MNKPISSKLCELCSPRNSAAMRALESLTPGGSEYVNDIQRCVEHVRERRAFPVQIVKQRNQMRYALITIGNVIVAPTMDCSDSEFQLMVLQQRIQDVSKIVQEALNLPLLPL